MADIRTKFLGFDLKSPFILGSGPTGNGARGLIECSRYGAGAVVTKTIYNKPCVNTVPHMVSNGVKSLINNEKGSDLPLQQWLEKELPEAKAGGVEVLIANIGETLEANVALAKKVIQAGADMIEVGGYVSPEELVETTRLVKRAVDVPVIAKVNCNWKSASAPEVALRLIKEADADGITAIDSVGTGLRLDLRTGQPRLGGDGRGYISGEGILPYALEAVYEIAARTNRPIVGMGGIVSGSNALEMLLAGAQCCGICSLPILQGAQAFEKISRELAAEMDNYGYAAIAQASGLALQGRKEITAAVEHFTFEASKCKHCGRCETVCQYGARRDCGASHQINRDECRVCGLCFSVCPTKAIGLEPA